MDHPYVGHVAGQLGQGSASPHNTRAVRRELGAPQIRGRMSSCLKP